MDLAWLDNFVPGTVSCNWPLPLIEKLKDNCTAVIPHIQVCDIIRNDDVVGNITLGIMLHCKCEERPSTTDRPYTNDRGILTAFENIHKEIEKNDVFFVIGKKPEERDDPISEFLREVAPCSESNRHPVRLNTSRYKFLRGTLVKDCDVLNNDVCGQQVGCPDWVTKKLSFYSDKYVKDIFKISSINHQRGPPKFLRTKRNDDPAIVTSRN